MKLDPLEVNGDLTVHDYEYLKGNKEYWPRWGAAYAIVSEWCKNQGYGEFGKPTERGKYAMEVYEVNHDG